MSVHPLTDVLLQHCIPPDPELFFSRNDLDDPRMGEITLKDVADFPSSARVALIGVPQDIGVERNRGRLGAALGPNAVRAMLYRMTPYDIEFSVSVPGGFLIDLGDIRCDGTLEEIHERLQAVVEVVCRAGLIPVTIGGGHDISYATVSGVFEVFDTVGALNLDAHLDLRPPVPERNSGTSFRMLLDEGKIIPKNFVEFGIQSFGNSAGHAQWLESCGGTIMTLGEIRRHGFPSALAMAYDLGTAGFTGLHGSLDLDGVCSSDAPGVSAPMPDGFTAAEFLAAARLLGTNSQTVSLDIAEMNPRYDRDNRTSKLAAHAVMHFLGGVLQRTA